MASFYILQEQSIPFTPVVTIDKWILVIKIRKMNIKFKVKY